MIDVIEIIQLIICFFFPIFVIYFIYRLLLYVFQNISINFVISSIIAICCIAFYLSSVIFSYDPGIFFLFSILQWDISIHVVGLIVPVFLIMIVIKKRLFPISYLLLGIVCISIISFFISVPIPEKGIVAPFPFWLLPAFFSSLLALFVLEKKSMLIQSAYAYSISTLGIIIGADLFHLPQLLSYQPDYAMNAIIGGASLLDLIFITGIISVCIIQVCTRLNFLFDAKKSSNKYIISFP